jgi:hypothetical protein
MAAPPVARSDKTVGWWEYLIIGLIAISSLPAYAAFLMALIAGAILKLNPAFLRETNAGGRLQAWADLARFFFMATQPVGIVIAIIVSIASFRSRATKFGWLIILAGFFVWLLAGFLIGHP